MSQAESPIVDAHLHVWRAAAGPTPGISTIMPPQTDVPIEAARAVLDAYGVARAVLVQPVFRGEDNSYVVDCARAEPERYAAVCVVDPRVAGADERLAHWVERGCRGLRLRPRIADEAAAFGDPSTFPLWSAAEKLGVVVSILCDVEHATPLAGLAERFPAVPIVVDHLAHPNVTHGMRDPDFARLLGLSRYANVRIKLSGYYHFTRVSFPFADCWDATRAIYERFGRERLLWGSDFPHVVQTCGYGPALELLDRILSNWSLADRGRVLAANALSLYWPGEG